MGIERMIRDGGTAQRSEEDPTELPYRSDLLASLGALLALWSSPRFHTAVLTSTGEPLDQASHQLIRQIGFRGPMRPSRLADELGTGRSNISKIIARLEDEELVERVPDPADARAKLVAFTPLGVRAAQHAFDLGDRLLNDVIRGWNAEDIQAYTQLTRRFTRDAVRRAAELRRTGIPDAD